MLRARVNQTTQPPQLDIRGPLTPEFEAIWTPDVRRFIAELAERFTARRDELLALRTQRQNAFDAGTMTGFLKATEDVRARDWKVATIPPDLQDRRVEITGPVDRKMIINALNSGAKVFMADFEDSSAPTWEQMIQGQINVRDAVGGTINFTSPEGKNYKLNPTTAVLMIRPRGWHLSEKHVFFGRQQVPGGLVDFGLFFFHNVKALMAKGTAPYFYLPKMESHLEARLWNDVFNFAQDKLGVPRGTIRATALIETLSAAFEMDEILYELREHAAGLNCGRWDYIFNFIKCFRGNPNFVLPAREQVTMTAHFLRSYSQLLIKTCHRRGIHAMGGMAAQIPNKDKALNDASMAKVRADKEREVKDGHDGTWVGHPGLVPIAMDVFDQSMPTPNQILVSRGDVQVQATDLTDVPEGTIPRTSLESNVAVSLHYLESWLRGQGCVPLNGLMEDAATAEIARVQVWQWIQYPKGVLEDGTKVTLPLFRQILADELHRLKNSMGDSFATSRFTEAGDLLDRMTASTELLPFLTTEAYTLLP